MLTQWNELWLVRLSDFPTPALLIATVPSWPCRYLQSCWWWRATPGSGSCQSAPRRRSAGSQQWWSGRGGQKRSKKRDKVRGWGWEEKNKKEEECALNGIWVQWELIESWTAFCYSVSRGAGNSAGRLCLNCLNILFTFLICLMRATEAHGGLCVCVCVCVDKRLKVRGLHQGAVLRSRKTLL